MLKLHPFETVWPAAMATRTRCPAPAVNVRVIGNPAVPPGVVKKLDRTSSNSR